MKQAITKHVGTSVLWTAALTSVAVLVFNRISATPLTEGELAIVLFALPVLLRALEPFALALRARLLPSKPQ